MGTHYSAQFGVQLICFPHTHPAIPSYVIEHLIMFSYFFLPVLFSINLKYTTWVCKCQVIDIRQITEDLEKYGVFVCFGGLFDICEV